MARGLAAFLLAAAVAAASAGCASPLLPYRIDNMTAEQLREVAKDRSAAAGCSKVSGPWGTGTVVTVNLDKGATPSGTTVEIGADCVVRIGGSKP